LCHCLESELANYLQLLATLEEEMHKDSAIMPGVKSDDNSEGSSLPVSSLVVQHVPTESSGMTFQKLALWADEFILKVRLMSSVVAEAKSQLIPYVLVRYVLIHDYRESRRSVGFVHLCLYVSRRSVHAGFL
jgi:hypothetical protein